MDSQPNEVATRPPSGGIDCERSAPRSHRRIGLPYSTSVQLAHAMLPIAGPN
jgi:hypothetical protein